MSEEYGPRGLPRPEFEVPEEITIELRGLRRAVLHFDPEGIRLVRGGKERRYSWDDVEQVRLFLKDQNDLKFESVQLKLPDRSEPYVLRAWGFWTGPEPEVVTAFFGKYVSPAVLHVLVRYTGPRTAEEAAELLEQFEEGRKTRLLCAFLAIALIVFEVLAVFYQDEPPGIFFFPVVIALFILGGLLKEPRQARKLRKLLATPGALEEGVTVSPAGPEVAAAEFRQQREERVPTTGEESERAIDSFVEKFMKTLWGAFIIFFVCFCSGVITHPLRTSSWVAFGLFAALLWTYFRHVTSMGPKQIEGPQRPGDEIAAREKSGEGEEEALNDE